MEQTALVRLRLDPGNVDPAAQTAARAFERIGQAGEVSARRTANAMRQLPAQLQDVAAQVAGGQNPLLILLQQGGQISYSFGGIAAAARGVAASIGPVGAAVGALAVGVGAFALAAAQGYAEGNRLRDITAQTGNAAGLTASRFQLAAEQISSASQQTVGAARDIVLELAKSGQVSQGVLAGMGTAVARVADVTGEDAKKVAADFARMSSGVAAWAAEHNKAWNFITVEQYKYISRLEQQGRAEEAAREVSRLVVEGLQEQATNLGYLERSYEAATQGASKFWDFLKSIGRDTSTRDQLNQAIAAAAGLADDGIVNQLQYGARLGQAREAAAQRVQFLKELLKLENQQADARARNAAANRAAIAAEVKAEQERAREAARQAAEAERLKREGSAIGDPRAALKQYFLQFEKGKGPYAEVLEREKRAAEELAKDPLGAFITDQLNAQQRRDDQRLEQQANFLQALRDETARGSAELIEDERARADALVRLDRETAERRLQALGLQGAELDEARRLLDERDAQRYRANERAVVRTAQLAGQSTYDDVRTGLAAAFRDTRRPIEAFGEAVGGVVYSRLTARIADALATSLVGSDGTGGLFGGFLSAITGGGSVAAGAAATYGIPVSAPFPLATGTNYVPRDNFPALLHRGEAVVPAQYNPAAGGVGGGITLQSTVYVAPGVSPAEFQAALDARDQALQARLAQDFSRGGVLRRAVDAY